MCLSYSENEGFCFSTNHTGESSTSRGNQNSKAKATSEELLGVGCFFLATGLLGAEVLNFFMVVG